MVQRDLVQQHLVQSAFPALFPVQRAEFAFFPRAVDQFLIFVLVQLHRGMIRTHSWHQPHFQFLCSVQQLFRLTNVDRSAQVPEKVVNHGQGRFHPVLSVRNQFQPFTEIVFCVSHHAHKRRHQFASVHFLPGHPHAFPVRKDKRFILVRNGMFLYHETFCHYRPLPVQKMECF